MKKTLIIIPVIILVLAAIFVLMRSVNLGDFSSVENPRVAIKSVDVTASKIYVQCTGSVPVKITDYVIKDSSGAVQTSGLIAANAFGRNDGLTTLNLPLGWSAGLSGSYTNTLVSERGGSFVSPSFTIP